MAAEAVLPPGVMQYGGALVAPRLPGGLEQVFRLVQITKFGAEIACVNVFHFGAEFGGLTAGSLASDWATNIVPTWKGIVTNNIAFQEVNVQEIHPTEGAISAAALSGTGGLVVQTAPVNSAAVLTWRTPYTGRRRRGRTYIAGMEYNVTGTATSIVWVNNGITRMNTLGNAILTRYTLGGNPAGFFLLVWSRKTYQDDPVNWRNAGAMVTRFTSQPYICTMGSRRQGRGL